MAKIFKLKDCLLDYWYAAQGHCNCGDPEARLYRPAKQEGVALREEFVRLCSGCMSKWEKERIK